MIKVLKIIGFVILGIVVLIASFVAFISIRGIPSYEPQEVDLSFEYTQERIEHGSKIVGIMCSSCHLNIDENRLSGKLMVDAPPEFGVIYSRNITHDPEVGIGSWTDGQLASFLRTGVNPDGRYIPPYMPKYINMSDEDLYSVIAFLRSDHTIVQPSSSEPPETEPSFLTKLLTNFIMKPFPYPEEVIETPDISDQVAYGQYLAIGRYECFACHSADFKTINYYEPEKSPGYFAGGNAVYDLEGNAVYSANITMDEETGIGTWKKEDFIKVLKTGIKPDGKQVRYPMIPYPVLTDLEIEAIFEYLKTIPKINNKVMRTSGVN